MGRVRRVLLRQVLPLLAVYLVMLGLIQAGVITDYIQATIATICINIILAVGLNLITGFTGQFSLGHAGFMAIGAYTTALVTTAMDNVGGFVLGLLAGALLAALVGLLVGLPTLRLRGDYLAIATLGMAEIIRIILLNLPFTNGAAGLSGLTRYVNWSWLFFWTVAAVWVIGNFLHSRHGRQAIAVREDEIAAQSIGVDTTAAKTLSFVVGAFFGGVAGGLYASYFYFIKPDLFNFMKSVNILVIVVLGGLGSLSGSVIAAIVLALVSMFLQDFPAIQMILYSLVLILLMLFRPQGLLGNRELSQAMVTRLFRRPSRGSTPNHTPGQDQPAGEEAVR